jgi:RNA polymerase sigma-70 factor (ECF subfamily)
MQKAEDDVRKALVTLYPRLRRFAETLTGSADRADDLVQVTCERALDRASEWNPATPLMNWLFAVMNEAWEAERKVMVQVTYAPATVEDAQQYCSVAGMEERLMLDAVRRRLLELPEEQRTVMTLVCVDGFSYKEAAETLNIRIGTVMSRIFRGKLALMKMLGTRVRAPAFDRVTTTR